MSSKRPHKAALREVTAEDIAREVDAPEAELAPYVQAAAVLSAFEPTTLRPTRPSPLATTDVAAGLLDISRLVIGGANPARWTLRPDVRREALTALGSRRAMVDALAQNPVSAAEAPPASLEGLIRGDAPSLAQQDSTDLSRTLQACRWLSGILPDIPAPERVHLELERVTLLEPFRRLVGQHFAGRRQELAQLRSYVDVLSTSSLREALVRAHRGMERPPLVIDGVGGVGKSTLVARFILDHIDSEGIEAMPFAYVDYDRPAISGYEPVTILVEAARQLASQAEPKAWLELRDGLAHQLAGLTGESSGVTSEPRRTDRIFLTSRQRQAFIDAFAGLLRASSDLPFLLVLDTFEEVQYLGEDVVGETGRFLVELEARVPQLRTIIAGRAPIEEFDNEPLHIGSLDDEAAIGYLAARGVSDPAIASEIVSHLGGNPLTLQLAARALERDEGEIDGIRTLRGRRRWFSPFSVHHDQIQGYLYRRILDHIHDDEVRKLAHPGLVLRRITPELILEVLAGPCDVAVADLGEARRLFRRLSEEVTLVVPAAGEVLEHRPDVRRVMLPLIQRAEPVAEEAIHRGAVTFYARYDTPEDRAEEIYHRLFVDDLRDGVAARWGDELRPMLAGALDELPPQGQVQLSPLVMRQPRDKEVFRLADEQSRVRRLEERIRYLLDLGRAEDAVALLDEEGGRDLPARLLLLRSEAEAAANDLVRAQRSIREGLERAHGIDAGSVVVDLLARGATIESELGNPQAAEAYAADGYRAARMLGDQRRQVDLALQWLASRRGATGDPGEDMLDEIDADMRKLDESAVRALMPSTAILGGELAPQHPRLLARVLSSGILDDGPLGAAGHPAEPSDAALALRQSGVEAAAARRVASGVSVSVQWPDAEVRAQDHIPYEERERWWVVYVSNASDEPIADVSVSLDQAANLTYSFDMGEVPPGRRWYIVPRDSGVYGRSTMPRAQLRFSVRGRWFESRNGGLEQLIGRWLVPAGFPVAESRQVAEGVRVTVKRPNAEVREEDRLDPGENWWVVYLSTEGERPVHRVQVTVSGKKGAGLRIVFPPIEPGRRRWWVLRPDSGFDVDGPPPQAEVEFDALGRRWLAGAAGLARISR